MTIHATTNTAIHSDYWNAEYRNALTRRLFVQALAYGFLIFMGVGLIILHSLAPVSYKENLLRFASTLGVVLLVVMGVFYALVQSIIFKPILPVEVSATPRTTMRNIEEQASRKAPVLVADNGYAGDEYNEDDMMDDNVGIHVPCSTLDAFITGEMRDTTGDEFVTLLQLYLIDAQNSLDTILNTAAHGSGVSTILRAAHSLKSASAHIGAERLASLASELEADARRALNNNDNIDTGRPYRQMKLAFDDTQKALATWLRYGAHDSTAEEYGRYRANNG